MTVEGVPASRGQAPRRRRRPALGLYACLFLVFLGFPLSQSWERGGASRVAAVLVVAAFCIVYAFGYVSERVRWRPGRGWRQPGLWSWLAALVALTGALSAAAGASGVAGMTYVACGGAALSATRPGLAIVLGSGALTVPALLLLGEQPLIALSVAGWITLIGLMVWGSIAIGREQESVVTEREEKAALAVELERTRLARDLHDILGHSLTVIAVKAELAGRLVDGDPQRAKAEIADLERLARDALADVRTTVTDYRQLSLATEVARAGRALDAAGIAAQLPTAVDEVPTARRDAFAWVVREGVTNVIRHSGAATCTITLTPTSVEVRDDGRARGDVVPGNGLTGLRERARQAGLHITTTTAQPHGFVLRAQEDS